MLIMRTSSVIVSSTSIFSVWESILLLPNLKRRIGQLCVCVFLASATILDITHFVKGPGDLGVEETRDFSKLAREAIKARKKFVKN